jgi:hypothetical protein
MGADPDPDPIAVALIVADALPVLGLQYTVGGSLASSMSGERDVRSTVARHPGHRGRAGGWIATISNRPRTLSECTICCAGRLAEGDRRL